MRAPPESFRPDDRGADLHREIHDLADLLGVRLRQRSTEDGEVLAEDEHGPAIDRAVTRHDTVTQEGFIDSGIPIGDERVELDERIGVEQQLDTLSRGQLTARVLLVDAFLAAAEACLLAHGSQDVRDVVRSSTRG